MKEKAKNASNGKSGTTKTATRKRADSSDKDIEGGHPVESIPSDVIAKFEKKLEQLRNGLHPGIGAAGTIQKLPDGGWQMDYGDSATIAMAPGTDTPFAVMGTIRTKWLTEGGAFNEVGVPGKLGYPVSDEHPYTSMGRPADRISSFQKGDITWNSAKNECYVALNEPRFKNCESEYSFPIIEFPTAADPVRAATEGPSSIDALIGGLSLEEKFAALKKLIAAIEEETDDLTSRLDDAE